MHHSAALCNLTQVARSEIMQQQRNPAAQPFVSGNTRCCGVREEVTEDSDTRIPIDRPGLARLGEALAWRQDLGTFDYLEIFCSLRELGGAPDHVLPEDSAHLRASDFDWKPRHLYAFPPLYAYVARELPARMAGWDRVSPIAKRPRDDLIKTLILFYQTECARYGVQNRVAAPAVTLPEFYHELMSWQEFEQPRRRGGPRYDDGFDVAIMIATSILCEQEHDGIQNPSVEAAARKAIQTTGRCSPRSLREVDETRVCANSMDAAISRVAKLLSETRTKLESACSG